MYPTTAEFTSTSRIIVRRSWRSMLSLIAMTIVSVAVIIAFTVINGGSWIRWLAFIPAILLVETLRRYYNDHYMLDVRQIVHHKGVLSLRYQVPVIRLSDVRATNTRQGLFARLLDYGSVEVSTAATAQVELEMIGVRAPRKLARLIDELRLRERLNGASEQPSGTTPAENQ